MILSILVLEGHDVFRAFMGLSRIDRLSVCQWKNTSSVRKLSFIKRICMFNPMRHLLREVRGDIKASPWCAPASLVYYISYLREWRLSKVRLWDICCGMFCFQTKFIFAPTNLHPDDCYCFDILLCFISYLFQNPKFVSWHSNVLQIFPFYLFLCLYLPPYHKISFRFQEKCTELSHSWEAFVLQLVVHKMKLEKSSWSISSH